MEQREELAKGKISRAERWTNEQKVLRAKQEGHQIMQAALDSGLINKNFTIGELHAKIAPSQDQDARPWYFLFGSSFFLIIQEATDQPTPTSEQQTDSYQPHLLTK